MRGKRRGKFGRSFKVGAAAAGIFLVGGFLLDPAGFRGGGTAMAAKLDAASHSTTIALSDNNQMLWIVNREANSVSVFKVRDKAGNHAFKDLAMNLAEIPVGLEPRCIALNPTGKEAYVTNALTGTVSVIDGVKFKVVATIPVGTEPRGCALTPTGATLYVANHTEGTVSIIDTKKRTVTGTVPVGGNPTAIAVTNNGKKDADERVFVTQIFAELRPGGGGEMRDLGKQGVVKSFPVKDPTLITKTILSPLADSGFKSNRSAFCPTTAHPAGMGIFCPHPELDKNDPLNTQNPQGVFPNQLLSALVRGNRLFLPNIGAQPEPPEQAEANVQALVHVVDVGTQLEKAAEHVNLNAQINTEVAAADPTTSLARVFANDIVGIDADPAGNTFLIVSRGGNYVLRASLDANGKLNIGAPNSVKFQTGNLPSGVVVSGDGKRAYANNEAGFSATSINLENNTVITKDIPSSEPPVPGTTEHATLVGKLAFFTALGIPDNGIFDTPIRDFVPLKFRGKQAKDGWSSCGSCHPDGLADGVVTWSFGTGTRQTKPLDGMFAKGSNLDDGILNWSAVRGSNTDFNANSRATQEGCGFASVVATGGTDPPAQCTSTSNVPGQRPRDTAANPAIYDHGIVQRGSDALDAQTLWIFNAVRPLKQPQPGFKGPGSAYTAGLDVFTANCASCHGGAKWTKSQYFHRDNPAAKGQNMALFDAGVLRLPVTLPPGVTTTPGVNGPLANELKSFACNALTFNYLDDIGTFNVGDPKELRDNGNGSTAFGVNGINSPSLLSINYHAPYLHNGLAPTLADVFPLHSLNANPNLPPPTGFPPASTIATVLTTQQQSDLLVFLKAIDGTTDQLRSSGDVFRDLIRTQNPPCPSP